MSSQTLKKLINEKQGTNLTSETGIYQIHL